MSDQVNHPPHYSEGKIEVIEFIEDRFARHPHGFHLGNAVKYCARAGVKDPAKYVQDLEKACWYIRRAIELHCAEMEARNPVRPNEMKK